MLSFNLLKKSLQTPCPISTYNILTSLLRQNCVIFTFGKQRSLHRQQPSCMSIQFFHCSMTIGVCNMWNLPEVSLVCVTCIQLEQYSKSFTMSLSQLTLSIWFWKFSWKLFVIFPTTSFKAILFKVSLKATNVRHQDHFKFTTFPWKRDSIKPESLYVKWNTLNPLINYLNYNLMSSIASIYSYLVFFLTPLFRSVTKCCVCDIYLTYIDKVPKVHYWLCIISLC